MQSAKTPRRKVRTPTMYSWEAMMRRCYTVRHKDYYNYGGRGITVCEQWKSFKGFLADMGERPDGQTLDRIDGDGNYEPGNCRWLTRMEQQQNTRLARKITFRGKTLSLSAWSRELGIDAGVLRNRLARYSVDVALATPAIRGGGPLKLRLSKHSEERMALPEPHKLDLAGSIPALGTD